MRRVFSALSGCIAAGLLLAGCEPREPPAASPATSPGAKVLRRGLGAEPGTLDPRQAEDNAGLAVAADLFEGLTTLGADGSVRPGAAASWSVATDGLTYRFKLRPALRWSNGEPLVARQFVVGLRALLDASSTAPSAGLFDAVQGVEAPDPGTLRVVLSRPVPYLPALLALPAAAPEPPSHALAGPMVGNGPFRLRHHVVGRGLSLERNPYYWDAARVQLDGVEYSTVSELGTELNLYRTGELDVTSEVPNTHIAALRAAIPAELHVAPYLGVYSYVINLARLPDRDVRLALAMTVDRLRVTTQVTGAGEIPAYGWIPDGFPGYSPARFAWRDLPYPQAVRRAQGLWAAAAAGGRAPGRLTLCTDASANHHRTAVALADLWNSALGVETSIVELEWSVYLDTRRAPGDCDLVRLGWSADFVDPEAFAAVFQSGHPQNTLGYRSRRYDDWLTRSRSAATTDERMHDLALAEQQLLDDVAVIPIFFRVSKRLVKPYVTGIEASPLGQLPSRDLGLEQN